jgi:hypothetical protein
MRWRKVSAQHVVQGSLYQQYLVTTSSDHSLLWDLESLSTQVLPRLEDPLISKDLIVTKGNELLIYDFHGKELFREELQDEMGVSVWEDRVATVHNGSIRFWPLLKTLPVAFDYPGPLLLTNSKLFLICYHNNGVLCSVDESHQIQSIDIPKIDTSKDGVEYYHFMEANESVVFLSQDISSQGVEGIDGPSDLFLHSYSTSLQFQYKVNVGKRFGFQTKLYVLKQSHQILVHFEIENRILILQQGELVKEMEISATFVRCFSTDQDWIVFVYQDGLVSLHRADELEQQAKELRIEWDVAIKKNQNGWLSRTQAPLMNDRGQLLLFPEKGNDLALVDLKE